MIPFLTGKFRTPSMPQSVVIGILILCGMVDLPRNFSIAGTTFLGAATLACTGIIWATFLASPIVPNYLLKSLLFLIFFEIYCIFTLIWAQTGIDGTQMLTVGLNFLGLILLSARLTSEDPEIGHALFSVMMIASTVGVVVYAYVVEVIGDPTDGILTGRAFALFALIPLSVALAEWRNFGQTPKRAIRLFIYALMITAVVGASMSRTALVGCFCLFPLAIFLRLDKKSVALSSLVFVLAGALLGAAIMFIPTLHDRFFKFDASMKVGGVAVNASGRTKIWDYVLRAVGDDWMFGKGVATSQILVRAKFNAHVGQPHNDYIRYYYDTGALGLALWVCFALTFYYVTIINLRRSIRAASTDFSLHVAALLAFTSVCWAMTTDNPVVYCYVMMPLGVVVGCSLGAGRPVSSLALAPEPDYFPAPQPMSRNVRIVS